MSLAWAVILRSSVCRCWFRFSRYSASSFARVGLAVVSSSTTSRAHSSRPAALSRGASRKPMSSACSGFALAEFGRLDQRLQPDRRPLRQPVQPVPDEDAVLVAQRHHVGDRPERGQAEPRRAGTRGAPA